MTFSKTVFVAGSAHLDVLARITGDEVAIDKIGEVSIEIGGTACNIAENLASMSLKPRLLTAMPSNSPYSSIIAEHLRSNGVDVFIHHNDDMPAAVFSAHIGRDGEMLSAVSSMPVDTVEFPAEMVREAMNGARCAIMDCNLSSKTLNLLAGVASEASIPVILAAVSEEKSLRLAEIDFQPTIVFMNRREAAYFGRRVLASTALSALSDRFGCAVVVTRDKDGVIVVENGTETAISPQKIAGDAQTLGAGDGILASTVAQHMFGGVSLDDSVRNAIPFASQIMAKTNCNAGQGRAVEDALIVLDRMATRDTLTGLPNRRMGANALERAFSAAVDGLSTFSVLLLDIDKFKSVNDTYGHDVGDEVIKSMAGVLSNAVRGADVACRWGGEEFLCVLAGADSAHAEVVAERIRLAVAASIIPPVGSVTVSIGVSEFQVGATAEGIVKNADTALYSAKHGGRNRVEVFKPCHEPLPEIQQIDESCVSLRLHCIGTP